MTQLSLLPDEVPDELVAPRKKRKPSLRAKARKMIRDEGIYNYALMVKEVLCMSDEAIQEKYNRSPEEVKTILYSEFSIECYHQEDVESYLFKVKNIPGFALKTVHNAKDICTE